MSWEIWRDESEMRARWIFAVKRGAPPFTSLELADGDVFQSWCDDLHVEIERRGERYRCRFTREESE